jgi:hypothetical protein
MEKASEYEQKILISGVQFIAMQTALDEFNKYNIDLIKYEITLFESDIAWIIVFQATDTPKGTRGSISNLPGFEVEIDKNTNKITRSNFVR